MIDISLAMEIKKKEDKTALEWEFLKYHSVLAIISEILIDVSKFETYAEDAIEQIREVLKDND